MLNNKSEERNQKTNKNTIWLMDDEAASLQNITFNL